MIKGWVKDLLMVIISALFGAAIFGSVQAWNYTEPAPEVITEYIYLESEPKVIIQKEYVPVEMDGYLRNLTTDEEWCLMDMAMREGANQGVTGQCWIMYTVICRAEAYGMTVREVWESKAFESSMSMTGKTPNEDCEKALALIEEGWTPKPLWFRRDHYHGFGTSLCQCGDHYFSCK